MGEINLLYNFLQHWPLIHSRSNQFPDVDFVLLRLCVLC